MEALRGAAGPGWGHLSSAHTRSAGPSCKALGTWAGGTGSRIPSPGALIPEVREGTWECAYCAPLMTDCSVGLANTASGDTEQLLPQPSVHAAFTGKHGSF